MPNLEQLASLRPHLIVVRASAWRRDHYGYHALLAIAPVLPVEVNNPNFRTDLTAQLAPIDRPAADDQQLADYDAAVREAQALVAERGGAAFTMFTMVNTGSIRL